MEIFWFMPLALWCCLSFKFRLVTGGLDISTYPQLLNGYYSTDGYWDVMSRMESKLWTAKATPSISGGCPTRRLQRGVPSDGWRTQCQASLGEGAPCFYPPIILHLSRKKSRKACAAQSNFNLAHPREGRPGRPEKALLLYVPLSKKKWFGILRSAGDSEAVKTGNFEGACCIKSNGSYSSMVGGPKNFYCLSGCLQELDAGSNR